MTFEVPEGTDAERLQYTPNSGFDSDTGQWDLTSGESSSPTAQLSPGDAGVGTAVEIETFDTTIEVSVTEVVDPAPPAEFSDPQPGNRLAAIQIEITNTGSIVYEDVPDSAAFVVDTDGFQFRASFLETDAGPGFGGSVDLPPGDSRVGFLVFEVPDGSTLVKLQISADSGFSEDFAEFDLG